MKLDHPGLLKETTAAGAVRWRVRVAGDKTRRITLQVAPDHPSFAEHYRAARSGIRMGPAPEEPQVIRGSLAWLIDGYIEFMQAELARGEYHKATVHQRTVFLSWLRAEKGGKAAAMPRAQLERLRDMKRTTPGAADNFVKAVSAMYRWGMDRGMVTANPAERMKRLSKPKNAGAIPWTADDLRKYAKRHPPGTMANRALALFMFTACRIGDAWWLGKDQEAERDGLRWMEWQPSKKGSAAVAVPMVRLLIEATRDVETGPYLRTAGGAPFASAAALGGRFRDWCDQAGLPNRSAHGIRKAAGELLALGGATQYHVMAIHGHTNAKTSEVYTKGAERSRLAAQAIAMLDKVTF